MIAWKRPFRVLELDARIYIIDSEWKRMTEIVLGQFGGYVPTREDELEVAETIAGLLNASDRWTDCSEQSPMATREAVG